MPVVCCQLFVGHCFVFNISDVVEACTSQATSTTIRRRGVAKLNKVRDAANLQIDFDPDSGEPLGDKARQYSNWVSLQARSKLSLLKDDWRTIDQTSKDFFWSIIMVYKQFIFYFEALSLN